MTQVGRDVVEQCREPIRGETHDIVGRAQYIQKGCDIASIAAERLLRVA